MKPFNLEAALRGEKVVTRDGREVKQLVKFNRVDHPVALWGVVDGEDKPRSWYKDGVHFAILNPSEFDLFMHEEPELAIWKPSACCSLRLVEKDIDGIKHRRLQQLYVNRLKPEYEWRDVPIVQEDPDV